MTLTYLPTYYVYGPMQMEQRGGLPCRHKAFLISCGVGAS